jgi:hypothetical protein
MLGIIRSVIMSLSQCVCALKAISEEKKKKNLLPIFEKDLPEIVYGVLHNK